MRSLSGRQRALTQRAHTQRALTQRETACAHSAGDTLTHSVRSLSGRHADSQRERHADSAGDSVRSLSVRTLSVRSLSGRQRAHTQRVSLTHSGRQRALTERERCADSHRERRTDSVRSLTHFCVYFRGSKLLLLLIKKIWSKLASPCNSLAKEDNKKEM